MGLVSEILSVTKKLRNEHEKRAEVRKFIEFYDGNIVLSSNCNSYKMSLGYLERFLMKAEKEEIDKGDNKGVLFIEEWSEGCGYFEGVYKLENHKGEEIKRGAFTWEGVGAIEDTWDMYKVFS